MPRSARPRPGAPCRTVPSPASSLPPPSVSSRLSRPRRARTPSNGLRLRMKRASWQPRRGHTREQTDHPPPRSHVHMARGATHTACSARLRPVQRCRSPPARTSTPCAEAVGTRPQRGREGLACAPLAHEFGRLASTCLCAGCGCDSRPSRASVRCAWGGAGCAWLESVFSAKFRLNGRLPVSDVATLCQ